MGLLRFFQRLLGGSGAQAALVAPVARASVGVSVDGSAGATVCAVASRPPVKPVARLMLLREEMLDASGRLAGYRVSCGASCDETQLSAASYLEALQDANVRQLAERRTAVLSIRGDEWAQADFTSVVGAHTVFLVRCNPRQAPSADCLAVLQAIRDAGAGLALVIDDEQALHLCAPALSMATHAFVDISAHTIEPFEQLIIALQEACPHLQVVVENVSTWPLRHMCVALGVAFSMGYFLSTVDEREQGEKLSDSRMVLMDMLNLVRHDGDAEALAAVAKRDPSVSVHLLSMVNAPAYGLKAPMTGIDQAIVVLGRETLYRWLAVSLFRAGTEPARDEALLEVALARASFLEKAGLVVGTRQNADELFLVGLLSFADTLLGMPMAAVLKELTLPAVVRDVLLSSEGPYGRFLLLALAVERCQVQRATQLSLSLGIAPDVLNTYRNEAQQWAEQAIQLA